MPLRSPAARFQRKRWGAALLSLLLTALVTNSGAARAAEFVDAAGRRVMLPEPIERVMPASPTAEVLVFVLAPQKIAALSGPARRGGVAGHRVPVLSWRPGMGPESMAATARRLHPDLIIDAGLVTPERAAFADQVQQLTGVPYILVDDSFARIPAILRGIAAILDAPAHGDLTERGRHLGRYAEQAINALRGRLLIRPPDSRPHVYYGRNPDGLEAALPGSPEGETIDQAGAINVAGNLGRGHLVGITPAQLFAWNPEIIIAERRSFYDALRRNRAWRGLAAVRNKRVYLAPSSPFGWIDDPPGVNRLIGLYWLSGLFYPDSNQEDLHAATCEFYDLFYRIKLTNGQIDAMLRSAGVEPAATPRPIGEPLVGLGAAPLPPLPSTPPAAPNPATPPASSTSPMSPLAPLPSSPTTPAAPTTTPALPGVQVPAAPSTAAATCTLPGANTPLGMESTTARGLSPLPESSPLGSAPGVPPPGRRGQAPGLSSPGALSQ